MIAVVVGMLVAFVVTGTAQTVQDVAAADPDCSGLIVNGGFEDGTPGIGANAPG
jgi:hypothetical protein